MQAGIAEAEAEMERMEATLANNTEIARAKKDFDMKKATYDVEVNTAKAEAELAYSLQVIKQKRILQAVSILLISIFEMLSFQAAVMQQKIKEQEAEVKVVERKQQIEIAEQEIMRKERELVSRVKKPAEAEKFRQEKIVEAQKQRIILEAEAEAEAIAVRGEAEAFAVEAKAKAEAEQMAKKADAWKEYEDAAMIDMLLQKLPQIAAEVSAPLTHANKITMISDGSSELGASKVTGEVMDIMARVPDMVKNMTGVDITNQLNKKG